MMTSASADSTCSDDASLATTPEVVAALLENHARFLAFLERRVRSREVAEDLLQEAFVRGIDRAASVRSAESATAWFYRLLRNALTDHYRRRDVERRALEAVGREVDAREPGAPSEIDAELMDTVCACVGSLIETLKPEYAEVVREVDLGERALSEFAQASGITRNNATVRLHRARQALKRQLERACGACAEHGCLDCNCHGGGSSCGAA